MTTPTDSEALPLTNCSAPVAWMRKWYLDGERPVKTKKGNGRWAWEAKYKFHAVTTSKCLPDDIPLFLPNAEPIHGEKHA